MVSLVVIGLMLFLVARWSPWRRARSHRLTRCAIIASYSSIARARSSMCLRAPHPQQSDFCHLDYRTGAVYRHNHGLAAGAHQGASRLLDPVVLLPLGTSAVRWGLVTCWRRPGAAQPVDAAAADTDRSYPDRLSLRGQNALPVIRGLKPDWREAASVLGASPWHVARIEHAIIGRAMLVAALFAFTVSMGQFARRCSSPGRYRTMPVVMSGRWANPA